MASLRHDYARGSLDESSVHLDPIRQFDTWFNDTLDSGAHAANAMALATATPEGLPSVRMVLLKGYDHRGFVFFTNYASRKGRELDANPQAALCIYWAELERQVRIVGTVEQTSPAESDEYFASRPEGSRFSAAASPQSEVIHSRQALAETVDGLRSKYRDGQIPRPAEWGGFRVVPREIEFWQGRPDRLHDRIRYLRNGEDWAIERLAP